jgi:hypothetical protein
MTDSRLVVEALRKGGEARPELAGAVEFHARVLEELGSVPPPVFSPAPGRPVVLPGTALPVDRAGLVSTAVRIAELGASYRPDLKGSWEAVKDWLRKAASAGGPSPTLDDVRRIWPREGADAGADASLLSFALAQALRPFLWAAARSPAGLEAARAEDWGRGECPVCGGEPDFAALGRERGARRLLCSGCDAEWPFCRTGCPFCGAEMGSYYPSPDGRHRLAVCDACGRYLKTVDQREAAELLPLPAERVLTLGMDAAARAREA